MGNDRAFAGRACWGSVGRAIHGNRAAVGHTGRMDEHLEGRHLLAALARRPFLCTTAVTLLGAGCIALSLALPLGIGFLALAIVGATAVVAGAVTMFVLAFGRLLGIRNPAARQEREDSPAVSLPSASATAEEPSIGLADIPAVDLRSNKKQSTAA